MTQSWWDQCPPNSGLEISSPKVVVASYTTPLPQCWKFIDMSAELRFWESMQFVQSDLDFWIFFLFLSTLGLVPRKHDSVSIGGECKIYQSGRFPLLEISWLLSSWTISCFAFISSSMGWVRVLQPPSRTLSFIRILVSKKDLSGWVSTLTAINPSPKAHGIQPFFGM